MYAERKAGAGSLDAQYAMDTVRKIQCPYAFPSRYGWDSDMLHADDFDSKGFAHAQYYVRVPDYYPPPLINSKNKGFLQGRSRRGFEEAHRGENRP